MAHLSACPSLQCLCFIIKLEQLLCDSCFAVNGEVFCFDVQSSETGGHIVVDVAGWFEPNLQGEQLMNFESPQGDDYDKNCAETSL